MGAGRPALHRVQHRHACYTQSPDHDEARRFGRLAECDFDRSSPGSAAIKLMQRVRATGSAAPARYGGHRRRVLAPHAADLRRLVEATPDLTLAELQTELQRRCGVHAGLSTIHNALHRLGLRLKKSP
jgi:transposase